MAKGEERRRLNVDMVVLVLTIGFSVMLILIAVAALVALTEGKNDNSVLGENSTQVLIAAIGGTIGVLGAYVGSRLERRMHDRKEDDDE